MKCMLRNKTEFYYALYESKEPITDEYGNLTGESKITYSNPVKGYANISAARGAAETDQFGINVQYDKVILLDDINLPINESSILWIDKAPEDTYSAVSPKHDYIVKRIARSLNVLAIAAAKVDIS